MEPASSDSHRNGDVSEGLKMFITELERVRVKRLTEIKAREGSDYIGRGYRRRKRFPMPVLANYDMLEEPEFSLYLDEQIYPLILDLGLDEKDFTSDFCEVLKSTLKSLSASLARALQEYRSSGLVPLPVNSRRMHFLQEIIAIIDLIAIESPLVSATTIGPTAELCFGPTLTC